ncbi:MAG: hypothetical protein IPK67_02355 [Planctomycetes bacterium]|nr:hypothetical protein [Planctomycetota bacterium]
MDLGEPRILEVLFRDEHGLEYSGPITVRVISQVTQRAQHLSFSAPPYFIPGLPVGPHSVAGMRGHSAAPRIGAEEFRAIVDIQDLSVQSGGSTVVVRLE